MVLTSVGHRRFRACGCTTGQASSISCARRSEQRSSLQLCQGRALSRRAQNNSIDSYKSRLSGVESTLWRTQWVGWTVVILFRVSNQRTIRRYRLRRLRHRIVGVPLWIGARRVACAIIIRGYQLLKHNLCRGTSVWVGGVKEKNQSRPELSPLSLWVREVLLQRHRSMQVQNPLLRPRHRPCPQFLPYRRRLLRFYWECSTRQRTPI